MSDEVEGDYNKTDQVISIPVVAHDNDDVSSEEDKNSEELGAVEKRVLEPSESKGVNTDLFVKQGFKYALRRSLRSPYLLANLVYIVYTSIIISIDLNEEVFPQQQINSMYLAGAIIHLINASMYIWVWKHEGFPLVVWYCECFPFINGIMVPEVLNMIEACLYISSASMYPNEDYTYPNGTTTGIENVNIVDNIENIETTASLIDWLASFGWVTTWYLTYRRILGRGWTLDDPDIWANLTIWAGTLTYVVYYCQIINDRSLYETSYLYVAADWVFFVNSLIYFLCALRDAGWFYLLPTAGVVNFTDEYTVVKKDKVKKK